MRHRMVQDLMWAYWGFASIRSASSTSGSNLLFWTCLLTNIFPGSDNQVGIASPFADRHWKVKNLSCGVALVAVQRRERIEWRASSSTFSHWLTGNPFDLSANEIAFHIIPLYRYICPFPLGVYGVVRLVAIPRLCKYVRSSVDIKDDPCCFSLLLSIYLSISVLITPLLILLTIV